MSVYYSRIHNLDSIKHSHTPSELLDTSEEGGVTCLSLFPGTYQAFDRVRHEGLLAKLKDHLQDTYFEIVQSYLHKRTYEIKCSTPASTTSRIHPDAPQGSIIGPYLYLIYLSDFPVTGDTNMAQFPDDVAVLVKGLCRECATKIQEYVHLVDDWSVRWRLKLSLHNSKLIKFTLEGTSHIITHYGETISQ